MNIEVTLNLEKALKVWKRGNMTYLVSVYSLVRVIVKVLVILPKVEKPMEMLFFGQRQKRMEKKRLFRPKNMLYHVS